MKRILIVLISIFSLYLGAYAQRIEVFGGYSYGSLVGSVPKIYPPYHIGFGTTMHNIDSDKNGGLTLGVNARIFNNLSI